MKLNLEENFNSLDLFSFRTWGCGANQPLVAKIRMTSINMILTKTMFYSCQNIFFTCPEFMKYRRKKIFRSDLDENEKIDHQIFSYLPLRASVQSSICFKIAQMSHMLHIAMIFITVKSTYYFLHSFREKKTIHLPQLPNAQGNVYRLFVSSDQLSKHSKIFILQ